MSLKVLVHKHGCGVQIYVSSHCTHALAFAKVSLDFLSRPTSLDWSQVSETPYLPTTNTGQEPKEISRDKVLEAVDKAYKSPLSTTRGDGKKI